MAYSPLLLLAGVPVIAGAFCMSLADRFKFVIRAAALVTSAAALAGAVFVFTHIPMRWQGGVSNTLAADHLSGFIGISIALFAFLITVYSCSFIEKSFGKYFGSVLMTLGGSFGVVFAEDFITLLVCWGALAIMLFLLVNTRGTDRAARAAKKAMIIVGGTDALMLFGIALAWSVSGTFYFKGIHLELKGPVNYAAYICIMCAAFAKAGVIPFHSWLPDVAEDAPAPVAAYLPASLDKLLGVYLMARMSLDLFVMNAVSNTILLLIGSATIVLAVISALIQHDLKRLLGYHAVSQVGYMVLGIGTANPIGVAGALFHMLNNAIYKSCLFLGAGDVERGAGTTDLSRLGALAKYMPATFLSFLVASLSISGIPPFNGFVSKWMIYQGIIELAGGRNPLWIICLVCAMFGSTLTVASFMKLIHGVFLGRPSANAGDIKEVRVWMWLPAAFLAVICFVFGIFAFQVPLRVLILPLIKDTVIYPGSWHPVAAAALLFIGIAAGMLAYLVFRKGGLRTVSPFIGGGDPEEFERISGVDFYNTIRDLRGLGAFYKREEEGSLDIYRLFRNIIRFFTDILGRLHNGVLPTYIVWSLLGMAVIFFMVFLGK